MTKLLDLKDNKIVISTDALNLSFFKVMWDSDKTKEKTIANDKIKYVYYFIDFNSPFIKYLEEDRHNQIVKYCLSSKDFKVTPDIKEAIIEYRKITTSPSMEMLEAATIAIHKMKDYFSQVDFTVLDENGNDKYNIDKITGALIKMPKLMEAINQAKDICLKEQLSATKVRGNATVGMFED